MFFTVCTDKKNDLVERLSHSKLNIKYQEKFLSELFKKKKKKKVEYVCLREKKVSSIMFHDSIHNIFRSLEVRF